MQEEVRLQENIQPNRQIVKVYQRRSSRSLLPTAENQDRVSTHVGISPASEQVLSKPQHTPEQEADSLDLHHEVSGSDFNTVIDNRPIATRKGIRECTKHPLRKFVSYVVLSPQFNAFTSVLDSNHLPKDIYEALDNPVWNTAVQDEMNALIKNKTWDLVDRNQSEKCVGCKWVFSIKYNSDGSISRHKARLVEKGFT